MGSKSPEGHQQVPNGGSNNNDLPISNADGRKPRTASGTHALEGVGVNEGADTDDDDDDDECNPRSGLNETVADGSKSQKKNKARKRAKNKKKQKHISQTSPPTVLISRLYPDKYPEGELVPYDNTQRTSKTEVRFDSDKWDQDFLQDYRHAAEIHRQVRQYAQKELIKPGVTLASIADGIEDGVRALCGHAGLETGDCLEAGLAFPTGLCLNNIAAHWTPNPGAKDVILQEKDVLKVDFGVHVNGRIVDSAFTVHFDPTFDSLSDAVKAATNAGIKAAGVGARISDISADIQETMESYEVEIDGKIHPVKAVRNLTGHDILRYQIHGGKQIPFTRNNSRDKMEEGEVFAIETFGTTGRSGYLHDDIGVYGYSRNRLANTSNISSPSAQSLLKTIDANFTTLPFSRRYLERLGVTKYHLGMKHLIDSGVVECYAPLVDRKGTFTAQWEHTILLYEGGKEVISRGEDY